MGLYSDALVSAADTQNLQAGGTGFISELSNALTYGAGAAVISGLGSIYNTAAAGINAVGGNVEQMDTFKKLSEIDTDWAKYYAENQNAIDVVGFVGTSIIPGSLAVKGLNAIRAGNAGNAFGRALGFAKTKQAEALDAALSELAVEGGTVFTRINKNKLAAMGWGFADQTITAAAFEVGVALTMKQSPILADDSWWDIGKSALVGAAFGGVIGGGIDSIILNRGFKDAVKAVDLKQRDYNYLANYEKFNLSQGDKSFGVVDSLLRLPDSVPQMEGFLRTPDLLAERGAKRFFDISGLLSNTLKSTERTAFQDFEKSIREIAATDNGAANSLANLVLTRYQTLKTGNVDAAVIREQLGDILFELKSVRPATDEPLRPATDLWYFNKAITDEQRAGIKTVDDWRKAFTSNVPFENNAYGKPYVFTGTIEDQTRLFREAALIGKSADEGGYPNLTAAWKDGKAVAKMPDGTFRVNDASPYWKRIDDPIYSKERYLNTRTGAITDDAVLTAADRTPAGVSFADGIKADGVYLTVKSGSQVSSKFLSMKEFNPAGDVEYFTARHAWAAKLQDSQLPDVIDSKDISLLDRLRSVKDEKVLDRIEIHSDDGFIGNASDFSIPDFIKSVKLSEAQRLFAEAFEAGKTLDVRAVAYQLNVDAEWLEQAVATRFRESFAGTLQVGNKTVDMSQGLSRSLDDYLQRENLLADYATPKQFTDLDVVKTADSWRDKRLAILDQVARVGGQFVTGELAWAYRVQAATQALKTAAAAVAGTERAAQLIDLSQDAAKLADSVGVGSSFFGSANANYGELLKQWSQQIGRLVHNWINEDVAKVVNSFATVSNRLRADATASAELGIVTNMLRGTDTKYVWNPTNPKQLVDREIAKLINTPEKFQAAIADAVENGSRPLINMESDLAVEFLKTHSTLNGERVGKRTTLYNARGLTSNMDENVVYAPPIDTTYFQHFAFVRPVEGKAFGTSEVAMVFGRNAEELSKRIALVDKQNFDVITKSDTEKFFKAKGDYDFNLTINEPRINSALQKSGALNNMFPEVRAENLIEDYIRWHQNQTARLVRDTVETNYAQQIAELNKLGENYVEVATSKFAGTLRSSKSEVVNPFNDYVKTALDVSKRSEYTFFHQANEFVDALGTRAYQVLESTFGDARKGIVSWQEANAIAEKHGIKGMYSSEADFFTSNVPRDRNLIKEYVSKANMLLANFVLRFDFANSVLNVVSTPLMLGTEMASIRSLIKNDSQLAGKLAELTSVKVPGENLSVPSNSRLVFNAVRNFFGANKEELLTRYRANGDIKDTLSQYHSMMDDLALRADFKLFKEKTDKAFEKVADLTGNNWAEQFTRFVSADVMRQLSDPLVEAGKLSLKEQNAYISTFVNRVQGNYISSQRPIVFQGVLGSAIGLFQTYSFNLLQQLLRHVENKDKRAVATLFGMQAGLFGLNGTPMFEAVNTHIIGNAAINDGHYDAYSIAPAFLGKEIGDWLLYGTASAMPGFGDKWPALYTRGDINPRHVSILPLNPVDVPAIDASIRVVKNIADVGSKLVSGADISTTLLQGLEHNGINRPLAGFAQVLAGQSTTSRGGLISASSDFSLITSASRIAGSRPMDESIALNGLYRLKAYQAADRERMEVLGERVKSYLYKNEFPPDDVFDGFMKDYAAAGGRVENFNAAMQRWARDANSSVIEKMRGKMQSSYGQRLSEIMGGEPLEDYRNQTAAAGAVSPE